MAIREIRQEGDEVLHKKSRKVENFDQRLHILLEDMNDTMKNANGVGLAAVQIGILRRVVVVDIAPLDEPSQLIELVNPVIIAQKGEQTGPEGCLSFPGQYGTVTRPNYVRLRAQDRYGKQFELEGEELLARAFCHELDHLEGVVYKDIATDVLEGLDDED